MKTGESKEFDVLIIGAGPAGYSCAIKCIKKGLKVGIIERKIFPRYQPGETFHPGLEVLFRELNVWQEVKQLIKFRGNGFVVERNGIETFIEYGEDNRGKWESIQILRSELDSTLLDICIQLGADLIRGDASEPIMDNSGRIIGAVVKKRAYYSKYLIDGSGHNHWLAKKLGKKICFHSEQLIVRYCYFNPRMTGGNPRFRYSSKGWTWITPLTSENWAYVELLKGNCLSSWKLSKDISVNLTSKIFGRDVTWRMVEEPSGPGFFISGDACAVLDPSFGKGVLSAIYSGMLIAENISLKLQDSHAETSIISGYNKWIQDSFHRDIELLREEHRRNGLNILFSMEDNMKNMAFQPQEYLITQT